VLDGIVLGFWKEEFFLYNFGYFSPKFWPGDGPLRTLTIGAIEHIWIFGKRISW